MIWPWHSEARDQNVVVWIRYSPHSQASEYLVPSWWYCLSRFRRCGLDGESMYLGWSLRFQKLCLLLTLLLPRQKNMTRETYKQKHLFGLWNPQWHTVSHKVTLPNSFSNSSNWRPSIQTHKPMRAILLHYSTPCAVANVFSLFPVVVKDVSSHLFLPSLFWAMMSICSYTSTPMSSQ